MTQPAAVTPRTSLYAQALHVGKDKSEAPTLQETNTGSLGALSDRLPLQRQPTVPVGVQISAPLWVLTSDRLPLQRQPTVPVGVQISAPLWVLTG